jgi:hypothetical protein
VGSLIDNADTRTNPRLYPPLTPTSTLSFCSRSSCASTTSSTSSFADYEETTDRTREGALRTNVLTDKRDVLGHLLVDAIGERLAVQPAGHR